MITGINVFDPPPRLDAEADAPDVYIITLKSLVTSWWLLAASWLTAGLILLLLGHPLIGAAQAAVGLGSDLLLQRRLRRRLAEARTGAAPAVAELGWIVLYRFTLGISGPLAAALLQPSIASDTVLVLMQAWSICVAIVQFGHVPYLMRRALLPLFTALIVGLAPALPSKDGSAIAIALVLLVWVVMVLSREVRDLSSTWISAMQRNLQLNADLIRARDDALAERDLAEAAREQAGRANAVKSEFLATMSHEIRTPLNGVLGMAQAVAAGELSDDQRERIAVIRQSGEGLLAILNDLLDVSKIEAGQMMIEAVEFDLAQALRGVHANFAPMAAAKGLELALETSGLEGVFRGDPTRIGQVIGNLVSNAVKFTEIGAVRIEATWVAGQLTIHVDDTGIGIDPAVVSRLFTPFTQADASTTRRFGGTGLGLSISLRLAELMDGSIRISSRPGAGTTFTFKLPLVRMAAAPPARASAPDRPVLDAAERPLRVLAAEDNPTNRLVLEALLAHAGVSTAFVENGALAVAAWQDEDWDLILMDIRMPVMDGLAAARAIRRAEAAQNRPRTPIVALTANAMSDQVAEYHAAGMDGHVAKPIEVKLLYAALQAAIDDRRAMERAA